MKHILRSVNASTIRTFAFGAVLSATVAVGLVSGISLAQANNSNNTAAANTLKISPVRSDIRADPGETKIVKVTVTNPANSKVGVRVIQNDFIAGDEDGTPAIYLGETDYAPSHSLKRFMTPVGNLTLEPNEARAVDVELKIPADAEPGGYFGVVRFAPTDPDGGGQVNVSASIGSLVLLTVNGDAPEKVDVTDFAVQQDNRRKTFFINGDGIELLTRFKNEGNIQAGPFGKVSVLNGDKVVYEKDFNNKDPRDVVLPASARVWRVPFENTSSFGHYTVKATFTYGTKNQSIEMSQSFWVIPRNVIIAAAVGLIVLIGAIAGGIFYFRRRNNSFGRSFDTKRRR